MTRSRIRTVQEKTVMKKNEEQNKIK